MRKGATVEQAFEATKIDPWFLDQMALINEVAAFVQAAPELDAATLRLAKEHGFSDAQLAQLRGVTEAEIRGVRYGLGIRPVYKTVDTCAGSSPRSRRTTTRATTTRPRSRRERTKVVIIGSGPNRIGQGVEFDYSCVHASFALSDAGYETIMVNCNPETVSTDYDTSDRLYFEPLTLEDVLEVLHAEAQSGKILGVVCQLGGQTPLGLAKGIEEAGYTILGTSPAAIDIAEERELFSQLLDRAGLIAPRHGTAIDEAGAVAIAEEIGYPVLVRPSFVLGGRGMEIVYDTESLRDYFVRTPARSSSRRASRCSSTASSTTPSSSTSTRSTTDTSSTSAASWSTSKRPASTPATRRARCRPSRSAAPRSTACAPRPRDRRGRRRAGLLNVQFAVSAGVLYVIEANPARAARCRSCRRRSASRSRRPPRASWRARRSPSSRPRAAPRAGRLARAAGRPVAVKEAVLPFKRFRTADGHTVDSVLGPEMRSTGEVMGIDRDFPTAFAKSQAAAYGGCRPRAPCSSRSPTTTSAP
jgi:carbamoyl-phosphate synthase large subunit